MNEFQLIKYLTQNIKIKNHHVKKGIGDDCAVLTFADSHYLLYTTDSLVEHIHFQLEWVSAIKKLFYFLGWKALAVNISDIYAMGGIPQYALVSLHIPKKIKDNQLKQFYQGINKCAQTYNISLVGGNITKSNHDFVATVTLIGQVPKKNLLLRSGACVNDYIYIQNNVGEASAGLNLLNHHHNRPNPFLLRHLQPKPFIPWDYLFSHYSIHSAIDISDGFMSDLNHILTSSKVGAEIYIDQIPVSTQLKKKFPKNYLNYILYGGEDYSILFTSQNRIQKRDMACIGKIIKEKNIYLVYPDRKIKVKKIKGFMHF